MEIFEHENFNICTVQVTLVMQLCGVKYTCMMCIIYLKAELETNCQKKSDFDQTFRKFVLTKTLKSKKAKNICPDIKSD